MSDERHWRTIAETAGVYGGAVASFLLSQTETRPLYNTHDANEFWRRGEMFIWLGQRMLTRARVDAKPPIVEDTK